MILTMRDLHRESFNVLSMCDATISKLLNLHSGLAIRSEENLLENAYKFFLAFLNSAILYRHCIVYIYVNAIKTKFIVEFNFQD